jgi:hypothetical protein
MYYVVGAMRPQHNLDISSLCITLWARCARNIIWIFDASIQRIF